MFDFLDDPEGSREAKNVTTGHDNGLILREHDASIVIAAIVQRGEEIKSAGGYLRSLTAKARAAEFLLGPLPMALLRGKAAKAARERKRAG